MATRPPPQRTSEGSMSAPACAHERDALDESVGAARFALEALAIERAVRKSLGLLPPSDLS